MDHGVVALVAERAAAAGLVALRFDFGGVRESEGDVSAWEEHLLDLRVASAAAAAAAPGAPAFGAGYSYGARAWLEAVLRPGAPRVAGLLLLAPPTRVPRTSRDFGDLLLGRPVREAAADARMFERLASVPVPARILVGEADAVAPPEEVRRHAGPRATVTVLPGLDHFFRPETGALAPAIDAALADLLAAADPGSEIRSPG
jgi:alpha/beta superfamily hydrolase